MQPQVVILVPVFNAGGYVQEALGSLLGQTYANIAVRVLDDGSTDGSRQVIDDTVRAAGAEGRVRMDSQENRGAVATLNRGLEEVARGEFPQVEFVALMHADDVALPERIEKQVAFFKARPEVDIAGTWMETFGGGSSRVWQYPRDPEFVGPSLLFWCCFAHPTMMFRRRVVDAGLRYDPAFPMPCEDYALWAEAAQRFVMSNVPEVLLKYREHPGQGGVRHKEKTRGLVVAIQRRQLVRLGISPTAEEMEVHYQFAENAFPREPTGRAAFLPKARAWLEKIRSANLGRRIYDVTALGKVLDARWAAAQT